MNFATTFFARFPSRQNLLKVYAVIIFLIYTWTFLISFYKLPGWLFYLNAGQIVSLYAYASVFNFAESILLLLIFILSAPIFALWKGGKEEFQSRSVIFLLVLLGSSMVRLWRYRGYDSNAEFVNGEVAWWSLAILLSGLLAVVVHKVRPLQNILEGIADRAVIFLFIYLPLSLFSLLIVMIRNL
jgi:hypothetical protein